MEMLIEKLQRLGATIIETWDTEQGTASPIDATQDDQDTDAHHTLIELCW